MLLGINGRAAYAQSNRHTFYDLAEDRVIAVEVRGAADAGVGLPLRLGKRCGRVLCQLFLSLQTCLLLAIISYLYVTHYIADTFVHDVPYQMISIYFGVFIAYFIVKDIIYSIVNTVFFSSKKNRHWIWTLTFITALEGIALFPVVMLQVYLNLTMQNVVYYFIFILILTKILTFYKSWLIFFRQIGDYLQIILYLCALEIIPLLSLIGILVLITDLLKVNI